MRKLKRILGILVILAYLAIGGVIGWFIEDILVTLGWIQK